MILFSAPILKLQAQHRWLMRQGGTRITNGSMQSHDSCVSGQSVKLLTCRSYHCMLLYDTADSESVRAFGMLPWVDHLGHNADRDSKGI